MTIGFDNTQLSSFLATVRSGSISQAAQSLGITQPAVSQQLRRLEDLLGTQLLRRGPRGAMLTAAGEAFLPYATRILAVSDQAHRQLQGFKASGTVTLGVIEDLATTVVTKAISDFASLNPDVQLRLTTGNGEEMQGRLQAGELQMVLGDPAYMRTPPRWTRDLTLQWYGRADILRQPSLPVVLFTPPCHWREPMIAALELAGTAWHLAFESNNFQAVHAAVSSGLGISAFLPDSLPAPLPRIDMIDFAPVPVSISLTRAPQSEGDRAADALEDLLAGLF